MGRRTEAKRGGLRGDLVVVHRRRHPTEGDRLSRSGPTLVARRETDGQVRSSQSLRKDHQSHTHTHTYTHINTHTWVASLYSSSAVLLTRAGITKLRRPDRVTVVTLEIPSPSPNRRRRNGGRGDGKKRRGTHTRRRKGEDEARTHTHTTPLTRGKQAGRKTSLAPTFRWQASKISGWSQKIPALTAADYAHVVISPDCYLKCNQLTAPLFQPVTAAFYGLLMDSVISFTGLYWVSTAF